MLQKNAYNVPTLKLRIWHLFTCKKGVIYLSYLTLASRMKKIYWIYWKKEKPGCQLFVPYRSVDSVRRWENIILGFARLDWERSVLPALTALPHLPLPNQELSGAKSELLGEMVGVCSFYKRSGQPPYNSALRSLQMCLLVLYSKWSIYEQKIWRENAYRTT